MRRRRIVLGLAAAGLGLAAWAAPGAVERARLIAAVIDPAAGPGPAPASLPWHDAAGEHPGDLYLPAGCARAALALVGGLTPDGKDDPRLAGFARDLADAGFAVYVPDMPSLREQRPGAASVTETAAAIARLADLALAAGQPRIGAVAVSFAVAPVLRAVADPALGARTALVVGIGATYDLDAVIAFVTTGFYRDGADAAWRHREPNAYGKWLFLMANASRVGDSGDRALLHEIARRRLADPAADVAPLAARLASEGRAVYALVANPDPARTPALVAALEPWRGADHAALDLDRHDLSAVAPAVVLIHGRDDGIVPYTESLALARALPADRTRLFVIDGLSHVDVDAIAPGNLLAMWRAAGAVLDVRKRMDAEPGASCLAAPAG